MRRLIRPIVSALALIAAALAAAPAGAEPPPAPAAQTAKAEPVRYVLQDGQLTLNVVDLSPQFLAFYAAAKDVADPGRRYELWRRHYGFAAVPPGPRGEAMAREMLEQAWPQYEAALPMFRAGSRAFAPAPLDVARKIAAVLRPEGPVAIKWVAYVGAFDMNAFTAGEGPGKPMIAVPLELPVTGEFAEMIVAHELTHAFHIAIGGSAGAWERTIGATALQEGLAMHVAREVSPGRPDAFYAERTPGWLAASKAKQAEILAGVRPVLATSDSETVFRFTIGQGATGSEREAYFVGWTVVEHLRAKGMTLAQIARIPEAEAPVVVARAIDEMLS